MADEFVDAYTNEAELRDLLAETPSLLPGIDEGLAAASKEMPIPGTRKADVVIVDAGGDSPWFSQPCFCRWQVYR